MKILGVSSLPSQVNQSRRKNYPVISNPQDSFEKSNSIQSPNFKGNFQETCRKIISNPTLTEKFTAMLTGGIVALIAGANYSKEELDKIETTPNIKDIVDAVAASEETTISTAPTEVNDINVNVQQSENISSTLDDTCIETETEEEILPIQEKPTTTFVFPKKIGRWSVEQLELKNVIERIEIPTALEDKLSTVCKGLISSKACYADGSPISLSDIINDFTENEYNLEEISKIIDREYELLYDEEPKEEVSQTVYKPEEELFTEKRYLPGVKVVGKLDPATIEYRGKKSSNTTEQDNKTSILEKIKEEDRQWQFQAPGTIDTNLSSNLTYFMDCFRKDVASRVSKKCHIQWMRRWRATSVSEDNVLKEIENRGKHKKNDEYININPKNAALIAETINLDKRYAAIFSLHSAMRFIDRYVKFDKESLKKTSLKQQSEHALDILTVVIQKAFSSGCKVEITEDFNGNIGAKLIIPSEYFNEEARQLFGTRALEICLCEQMQPKEKYNPDNRRGVIGTMYSK